MRLALPLSVLTAALCVAGSPAAAQSEGLSWRSDLQAAQAEAAQTGKLVLAHFWTESCGPCKVLEQRVFSQPSVAMAISGAYVPVKINATEAPELAQKYGVTRVPTDAVVTANGELVKAFISPATPMEYVGYVTQLASAYKAQAGRAYSEVAANAPAPNGNPPSAPEPAFTPTPDFSQAYAGLLGQRQQPAQPTQTPATVPNTPAANPYANQVSATAPPSPPTAPPTVAQQQPQVAASTPPAPKAIELPPGSPPLGFDGYCPVALRKENRWAKGDVSFGAIHEGRTYLFTSQEAQREFLASPNSYSPVLSGVDPVVAVDQRRSVPGSREFGVEYPASGGRFYLFSSEQSLEKFWGNPDAYAQGVERVAALPAGESFVR